MHGPPGGVLRRPAVRPGGRARDVLVDELSIGKLPHGGVSERPKEHASKACDG